MALPPTGGDIKKTVFLDAGHGGLDPGAAGVFVDTTVTEKDVTLAVAGDLASALRAEGYGVVMARTVDSTVAKLTAAEVDGGAMSPETERRDLLKRVECANRSGAAVLLSIHMGGFDDPTAGGTETIYDAARPFAADNARLANDLQQALVMALGYGDRGVETDDQLSAPTLTARASEYGHLIELGPASPGWVDAPSTMPGALVEPLFVTNSSEAAFASSAPGAAAMARALHDGLVKFLSAGT